MPDRAIQAPPALEQAAGASDPGAARPGPDDAARSRTAPLRLAYLMNQYPAATHTFVRRELRMLERLGHSVVRLTIRRAEHPPVDPVDMEESAKTVSCLDQPAWNLLLCVGWACVRRPAGVLRALRVLARSWRVSGRGLVTHAAYAAEAAFLLRLLARRGVEHVHVHFGTNAATVIRVVRAMGGPTYSVAFHGSIEWDEPRQQDIGGKAGAALFSTAISSFAAAQVMRWSPPEVWSRVHVIRCGVDGSYLNAGPMPIDADNRTLVTVGRLGPEKGSALLVRAFAGAVGELGDRAAGARLVFVGDGPMRPAVERLARELGVGDRVELKGWQPEAGVRAALTGARVFVLPSFMEGLPVVIMEALALGRPVIATYVGGVPELVEPGVSGWLVPAGDEDATRRAIVDALSAPAERLDAMGRAGRRVVLDRHNAAVESEKLEAILRRHLRGTS